MTKTHNKTLSRSLLAALIMTAGTGAVLAQPGGCGGMGSGFGGGPMMGNEQMAGRFQEMRQQRMEQQRAKLHDALKLAPEQEGAWKKFTESQNQGPLADPSKREEMAKLSAPERAERMLELSKKQQERMSEHLAALKTFYATLSPEQKKTFDEFSPGPRSRRGAPQENRNTQ